VPIKVHKGQTVCALVSGVEGVTNKGHWIGFAHQIGDSSYLQPTHLSEIQLLKIKAEDEYNSIVALFDQHPTAATFTVYIDDMVYHYNNFSIIGDSYSTFSGYIPENNVTWYPTEAISKNNDCQAAEDTWWYQFAQQYGSTLHINQSYSGSPICNDGYGSGTTDATSTSFIARMKNITMSDLIFIFGGTNDEWINGELGDYVYNDWTTAQLSQFRPALAYMLNYLITHHLGAKIVFIKNTDLTKTGESIDTVCAHYNIPVIALTSAVTKVSSHPDKAGMDEITAQVINGLLDLPR